MQYTFNNTVIPYKSTKSFCRDLIYLQMANKWSENSVAKRAKVGALIVKDNIIISDGYNGMPAGFDNCCETVEVDKQHHAYDHESSSLDLVTKNKLVTKPEVLHAESNALMKLCKNGGFGSNDAILYCTYSPCIDCAKLIVQSGIKQVHFTMLYRNINGLELILKAGIEVFFHVDCSNKQYVVSQEDIDTLNDFANNKNFNVIYHVISTQTDYAGHKIFKSANTFLILHITVIEQYQAGVLYINQNLGIDKVGFVNESIYDVQSYQNYIDELRKIAAK